MSNLKHTNRIIPKLLKPPVVIISLLFLLMLATGSFAASTAATGDKTGTPPIQYTFAVIPFYSPEKIWTLYSPFVDYLSRSTGLSWQLKLYSNHDDLIDAICTGKVSAALLGPVPLGRANHKCGATPLLAALDDDGKPSYHSVILTNTPSVRTLKDLKGKKIGFFKGSTAAHIVPTKMLKDAGIGMSAIQPIFLESQDRIMSALLSGEVAAAGVKENLAIRFGQKNLKVLKVSAPLPNFALCTTPALSPSVRQQMLTALTSLKPLVSRKDAATMKGWDDEINNGFVLPGKNFLPSVVKLFEIFKELQHDH